MITGILKDGRSGKTACINQYNQLVIGNTDFSTFYQVLCDVDNQSYKVVAPMDNNIFIITAIILSGNRNVGVNGSVIQIYESIDGPATGTVSKVILTDDLAKQTRSVMTGINIKVTKGSWINAECDDDDVRVSIAGYYVKDLT